MEATPYEIKTTIQAKRASQAHEAWLIGQYVMVGVGMLFSGKKNVKYPDDPLQKALDNIDTGREWTEEELEYYRQSFHSRMRTMFEDKRDGSRD